VLQDNVGKLVLFKKMSLDFQQRAFSKLRPGFFKADEVIFHKGDASRDLLFLTKGEAGVLLRADETITEMRITPTSQYKLDIVDGSVTIEMRSEGVLGTDTLLGRRRAKTHMAISDCEVFLITKEDLTHLLEHDPQSARTISRALMRDIYVMDQLDYYASLLRVNGPSDPSLCRVLRIQHHWRQYCNLLAKQDPLYLMLLAADAEQVPAQARRAGAPPAADDSSFRSRRHLFPKAVIRAAGTAGGFGGPAGGDAAEIKAMRVQMSTMLTMLESLVRSSRNTRLNERSSNSMPTPSRLPAPSPGVNDSSILGWMADSMSSGVDASTARRDLIMGRRSSVGSARAPSEYRQKQLEDTSA
jgi:CRP-like cAMP-binding protein